MQTIHIMAIDEYNNKDDMPVVEHAEAPREAKAEEEHRVYYDAEAEDTDDFSWNYDVLTNLLVLYLTYFASTWAMSVLASSIAYIMYEFPSDHHTTAWIGAGPSLVLFLLAHSLEDKIILGLRRLSLHSSWWEFCCLWPWACGSGNLWTKDCSRNRFSNTATMELRFS